MAMKMYMPPATVVLFYTYFQLTSTKDDMMFGLPMPEEEERLSSSVFGSNCASLASSVCTRSSLQLPSCTCLVLYTVTGL